MNRPIFFVILFSICVIISYGSFKKFHNFDLYISQLNLNYNIEEQAIKKRNSGDDSNVWFYLYELNKFWIVDKTGKIIDLKRHNAYYRPFVTGVEIDENGKVVSSELSFLPEDIPDGVFEINLKEKYVVTSNSAIVHLVDLEDLKSCLIQISIKKDSFETGKQYIYRNRKFFVI